MPFTLYSVGMGDSNTQYGKLNANFTHYRKARQNMYKYRHTKSQ